MHEVTHNLTEWMEWGKENGKPLPSVAKALGDVARSKQFPAVVHNMLTVLQKTRACIEQMQKNWGSDDFFEFHLLGNHSPFLKPEKAEKKLTRKYISVHDAMELVQFCHNQMQEQDRCVVALGLPKGEALFDSLENIYGNRQAVDKALTTIAILVGCRVMMEELLVLLRKPAFLRLKNVKQVAASSIILPLLDPYDELPSFPELEE